MKRSLGIALLFFLWLFLLPTRSIAQQGVLFTQYLFNGLILNPAYAGYQDELTVNTTFRSQWIGFPAAPKSFSFSGDGPIIPNKFSFGLLLGKDQLGAQENLQAELDFSYRVKLSQFQNLAFGVGGNINQNSLNTSLLVLLVPEMVSSTFLRNSIFPNLRFGMFWSNPNNYLGFSANDLRNIRVDPGKNYIGINPNYYLTGGNLSNLSSNLQLKSSFLLSEDFINPTNLDLNIFFLFPQDFWLGLSYRTNINLLKSSRLSSNLSSKNSVSFSAEIFTANSWRLGYAFDYSLNQLADVSQGSHEFSVSYHLNKPKEPDRTRKCYYF